jgi:hypothetical protein
MFPPVHASVIETIPDSWSLAGRIARASDEGPNLGKLAQHQIGNIVGTDANDPGPMEKQIAKDRAAMTEFLRSCG